MLAIGFEEHRSWMVYEGDGSYGHAVWPAPVLAIATVLKTPDETSQIQRTVFLNEAQFIFREDSFDPVTRIRRGRLYEASKLRPEEWWVQPNPAYPQDALEAGEHGGWLKKRLYSFRAWPAPDLESRGAIKTLVALGTQEAYTLWRVVDTERVATGEYLLTMRSRSALGVLPELDTAKIPQEGRSKVLETIDRLSNSAYRAGPEDVVESARAAAQWCLAVWLAARKGNPKLLEKDLGSLVKMLEDDRSKVVAQLVARLHSRAKPNEQQKYETRPVQEGDAEFALASIGMLLRELEWTV